MIVTASRRLVLTTFAVVLCAGLILGQASCRTGKSGGGGSSSPPTAPVTSEPSAADLAALAQVRFATTRGECPIRGAKLAAASPESVDTGETRLSPHFILDTDQPVFREPVTVTLPFDPTRLPKAATARDVYPVLTSGPLYERLDVPVTVGADGKSITFALTRLVPLINSQTSPPAGAAGSAPQGPPALAAAAASPDSMVVLETSPTRAIWTTREWEAPARAQLDKIKARLALVEDAVRNAGFEPIASYRVNLKKLLSGYWAMAGGGRFIDLNMDMMNADPEATGKTYGLDLTGAAGEAWWRGVLAHEYFHLVQQRTVDANAAKSPGPHNYDTSANKWLVESTADFMATQFVPEYVPHVRAWTDAEIGYRPLQITGAGSGYRQSEYQSFVFFSFLNTIYDGPRLVRAIFDCYMNDSARGDKAPADEMWSPAKVVNKVLRALPDRKNNVGARNLRGTFGEYLMHLYWQRDFAPVNVRPNQFWPAEPGILYIPRDPLSGELSATHVTQLTLPQARSGGDIMSVPFKAVPGSHQFPYLIIHSYWITNGMAAKDTYRASLWATITADSDCMLVAFPMKQNKASPPVLGTYRLEIPDWQQCQAAVVWVVDIGRQIPRELEFKAEVRIHAPAQLKVFFGSSPRVATPDGGTVTTPNGRERVMVFYPGRSDNYLDNFGDICKRDPKFLMPNKLPVPIRITRKLDWMTQYIVYTKPISEATGKPQYILPQAEVPIHWKGMAPDTFTIEVLNEHGETIHNAEVTVNGTHADLIWDVPRMIKVIDDEKAKPTPNRQALLGHTVALANHCQYVQKFEDAWSYITEAEKDYAAEVKANPISFYADKSLIAWNACQAKGCQEALEQLAAAHTNADEKARCYERAAEAALTFSNEYPAAKKMWLKANEIRGKPDRDWPYWPDLKDVP